MEIERCIPRRPSALQLCKLSFYPPLDVVPSRRNSVMAVPQFLAQVPGNIPSYECTVTG